ncbi:hypothetical protein Tco_1509963 [Tanacetum coccineum]
MIYLIVLADATESVRHAIGFNYDLSIECAPFEALYGRKCRLPGLSAEIGESSLTRLELVQEITDKSVNGVGVTHGGKFGEAALRTGTGLRMKRTNRRTRVPIDLYPCHIEEKMTIKEVKGESIMEWKTKMEYVISDSDSDLESTASS